MGVYYYPDPPRIPFYTNLHPESGCIFLLSETGRAMAWEVVCRRRWIFLRTLEGRIKKIYIILTVLEFLGSSWLSTWIRQQYFPPRRWCFIPWNTKCLIMKGETAKSHFEQIISCGSRAFIITQNWLRHVIGELQRVYFKWLMELHPVDSIHAAYPI